MIEPDVIDMLAGLTPDSPLAKIRDRKPITREQAQASYRALFEPSDAADVSLQERFAVATFVAGLHAEHDSATFYAAGLARAAAPEALVVAIQTELERGRTTGPYGAYPKGPLSSEDSKGLINRPIEPALGRRLTAAFAHVHMLVFHPRDADPAALQSLLEAGWSNGGIVTLSQLVAFLAFQVRAVAGLRILAGTPA